MADIEINPAEGNAIDLGETASNQEKSNGDNGKIDSNTPKMSTEHMSEEAISNSMQNDAELDGNREISVTEQTVFEDPVLIVDTRDSVSDKHEKMSQHEELEVMQLKELDGNRELSVTDQTVFEDPALIVNTRDSVSDKHEKMSQHEELEVIQLKELDGNGELSVTEQTVFEDPVLIEDMRDSLSDKHEKISQHEELEVIQLKELDGNGELSVTEQTVFEDPVLIVDTRDSVSDKHEKMSQHEELLNIQLKEAIVEKIKSLVDEDIFIDIKDLINIIASRAEETFQEHANKASNQEKFYEEYKAMILRKLQDLGETFQLKLLENSSQTTEGLSVIPEDLHEIAIEEFSKLGEEFKNTIGIESMNILEETNGIKIPEALIDKKEIATDYDTTDRDIVMISGELDSVEIIPNALQKISESEGERMLMESDQPMVKDPAYDADESGSALDQRDKARSLVESEDIPLKGSIETYSIILPEALINKKELKESIESMLETFASLISEKTLKVIKRRIDKMVTRAEEIFQKHADKVSELGKFYEEYKAMVLRESQKMGETFQWNLLEKSSHATGRLSVTSEDLHEIAIAEFSKLSEEFKKTIFIESVKILEETYGIILPETLIYKKELKESIYSMVEIFASLLSEKTLTVMKGRIDMIVTRAEEIFQKHADKVSELENFYEEYKAMIWRESQKLGETFQLILLEKSPQSTGSISVISEDLHEIAIEEFSKLSKEFKNTIDIESVKILEETYGILLPETFIYKKELKESIESMLETFVSLVNEETLTAIKGQIDIMVTRAKEIFQKHSDKVSELGKFYEEYKAMVLRESKKLGETFQLTLLKKSSQSTGSISAISEDLNEIAIKEFSKLSEEFKNTIDIESVRILEETYGILLPETFIYKKELKESIDSMVETFASLLSEETLKVIKGQIDIMVTRVEEIFQKHSDKVSELEKFYEEYKAMVLRESQKLGETFQLILLEKSSKATGSISVISEDLHEIAIEEFSKLSEEFKNTIDIESVKILEETYGILLPETFIYKKELKESIDSMVETFASLLSEETLKVIKGQIDIMVARAEEIFQKHSDKVSELEKFYEEYKAMIWRESQKLGETFQLILLEKSSQSTGSISAISEDLHEIAIAEFSKLGEEFKNTIDIESVKILEETYGILLPETFIYKKELKESIESMVETFASLLSEETLKVIKGQINIMVSRAEEIFHKHADIVSELEKFYEEYKAMIWRESQKLGETFQLTLLEKSSQATGSISVISEDLHEIAIEEFSKLGEAFKKTIFIKSVKILEETYEIILPETLIYKKELKESIDFMVGMFASLVSEETLTVIKGQIDIMVARSEEIFQKHADIASELVKFYEEYKAMILRESHKLGETFQLTLLEKSSQTTGSLALISKDLNEIAIEEFSKLSEEFKKKICMESVKILEETYDITIPEVLICKDESKESMVETFKILVDKETLTVIKGLIDMIASRAEKILQENADKITDWKLFYEEYKRVMLIESQKLGEIFQLRLLEKSCEAMTDLSAIPENFHDIAREEFSKLSEEFSETINKESLKLIEGQYMSTEMASLLYTEVGRRTLAIIKPDAYEYADEILYKIKKFGFTIVQERRVTLTPEQASLFYGEHLAKAFSLRLIQHMSSGPIVALCLASAHCPNTITAWREVMGPTDVSEAVAIFPNTLRAEYGDPNNQVKNALHGSHTLEDAEREIHFFFPDIILDPLPKVIDISSVLDEMSRGSLHKALVVTCKEKPGNTLSWFAHWLKNNAPNGPRISTDWNPITHPIL